MPVLAAIKLKLPPEVAFMLAVIGAVVLTVGLGYLLLRRLGRTGALVVAGVMLVYLGATLLLAVRRNAAQFAAASQHAGRLVAVRQELARLAGAAPRTSLRDACSGQPGGLPLEQLGLVYTYGVSGDFQRLVGFRRHDGGVLDRERQLEPASAEDLIASWWPMLLRPWQYEALLAERGQFPLTSVRRVVVTRGEAASLLDLETGAAVCEGRPDAPLRDDDPNMRPHHLAALAPVCRLVADDLCAALTGPPG